MNELHRDNVFRHRLSDNRRHGERDILSEKKATDGRCEGRPGHVTFEGNRWRGYSDCAVLIPRWLQKGTKEFVEEAECNSLRLKAHFSITNLQVHRNSLELYSLENVGNFRRLMDICNDSRGQLYVFQNTVK
ncbi:hypothetical protein TNCT_624061 [Trichonephila clavata]|uniref:Uncharacterized protein n=1 Tax=Trichonephila clavata TaxID=2740835 RepID=A0A8X6LAX3_TRICU|nr:hypothetical protein TNCT_624061 [Trichonephila clavata]